MVSPVMERFIDCWGELGARWGVNRTVAQVHALFYLSAAPLNAEEIAAALGVARSNASTSLRELESWGLIKPAHIHGDRRQHFESIKDVWEMFRIILDERKRREIDPSVEILKECLRQAEDAGPEEQVTKQRLKEALDLCELMMPLYNELRQLPNSPVRNLVKLTSEVRALVHQTSGT
jgi:DNA-binding transcriptional regulator GbsR (MarR family)